MRDSAHVARLKNEVATLRGLIALTPPGAGQRSLAARLSAVESELAATRDNVAAARVDVVFEGGPVIDTAGIEVGFLAHTLEPFGRAVDAEVVAKRSKPHKGQQHAPVPKLFVTESIVGSFGFRLEELRQLPLPFEGEEAESELSSAVARVATAIATAPLGDEWDHDLSPGALLGLKAFFGAMKGRSVSLRLSHRDTTTVLTPDAIKIAADVVERIDETETEERLEGTLTGVEREANEFEFLDSDGSVVRGQVGASMDYDTEVLPLLEQRCRAQVHVLTRKYPKRTTRKYTLIALEPI